MGIHIIKGFALTTLTSIALVSNLHAVEPLSDSEMGDLVVIDPYGATAAGGQIDTTTESRTITAESSNDTNQAAANDPNNKQVIEATPNVELSFRETLPEQYSATLNHGIQIQTQGSVQQVNVNTIMNNPGNATGGQSYQNFHIDSMSVTRQYR